MSRDARTELYMEEREFLDWWIPNANIIIENASKGNKMFEARRIARIAWFACRNNGMTCPKGVEAPAESGLLF